MWPSPQAAQMISTPDEVYCSMDWWREEGDGLILNAKAWASKYELEPEYVSLLYFI